MTQSLPNRTLNLRALKSPHARPTSGNPPVVAKTRLERIEDRQAGLSRATRLLRRFPATSQLLAPYIVLILPQAYFNDNPDILFIVGVLSLALAGTAVVEFSVRPTSRDRNLERSIDSFNRCPSRITLVATIASLAGVASGVIAASLGVGTVAAQVGRTTGVSPFASALSVFGSWAYTGTALMVAAYLSGYCSKRRLHLTFLAMICLEAVRFLMTMITLNIMSLMIYLVLLLVFAGTVSLRQCVIIAVVIVVAWPTTFALRNELRRDAGVSVSTSVDAYDRLRYDLQITRAAELPTGIDLGQPGPLEVIRYGLVPRVIDSDRPELATGKLINAYLGGLDTTSYNFLPVTTLYVLEGPTYVVLFYALIAVALYLIVRRGTLLSPTRLALFGMVSFGPLGWFGAFPDSTVGALQALVASVPLLFLCRLRARTPSAENR